MKACGTRGMGERLPLRHDEECTGTANAVHAFALGFGDPFERSTLIRGQGA
jgi:hypothetical protein